LVNDSQDQVQDQINDLDAIAITNESPSLSQRLKSRVSSFSNARVNWKKSKEHWFNKDELRRESREQEVAKMLDNNEQKHNLLRPNHRFQNHNQEDVLDEHGQYRDIWHNSLTSDDNIELDSKEPCLKAISVDQNDPTERRASIVLLSIDEAIANKT
jgi:hypothetical protein